MADDDNRNLDYWPMLIQAIRSARNWSQFRFAEEVDSSQETVSRWERGAVVPSRQKQRLIEALAETANISSLGGISHIVRLSPYPMLLCDGSDHVIAASTSSGFQEGRSVISQTPEFQHAFFLEFSDRLKASGFWEDSGRSADYHFASSEFGDFKAVLVSIRIHGAVYCVVQAIPPSPA
ncbi:MAG: helix-turn-helix transcriptional regulator [Aestuariivirga sp.]|uniref:helix-turn-helix domain-containing protein n=1 Tax=Aestuariivirga sp. TaxID=2650926 RepID=UPI00301ABE70